MDVLSTSRRDVAEEIAKYCRGDGPHWQASPSSEIHGKHTPKDPDPDSVSSLMKRFSFSRARTIYATANVCRTLTTRKSINDPRNIIYSTPWT